jgi:hypothetical protein
MEAEATTATLTITSTHDDTLISSSGLLLRLCSIEDVFQRHLLSFLTYQDVGRLELVARDFTFLMVQQKQQHHHQEANSTCGWKILCERDFPVVVNVVGGGLVDNLPFRTKPVAPVVKTTTTTTTTTHASPTENGYMDLQEQESYKASYRMWKQWQLYTADSIHPQHMVTSIQLWTRIKHVLTRHGLTNILSSLAPCPSSQFFQTMNYLQQQQQRFLASVQLPQRQRMYSALLAWFAVHGGQLALEPRSQDNAFFAGLLGSYSCYHDFYSMRLINIADYVPVQATDGGGGSGDGGGSGLTPTTSPSNISQTILGPVILIGASFGSPRSFLYWCPTSATFDRDTTSFQDCDHGGGGVMMLIRDHPINQRNAGHILGEMGGAVLPLPVVGRTGILGYFADYVERLERGFFQPCTIVEASPNSRGICLFPDEEPDKEPDNGTLTTSSTTSSPTPTQRMTSCCVTRGIEVKASARWFLPSITESSASATATGLNFGYSIRIRMVSVSPEDLAGAATTTTTTNTSTPPRTDPSAPTTTTTTTMSRTTFQLVGRHWEFQDGRGKIRRVDGDAVIGKQPMLYYCRRSTNNATSTSLSAEECIEEFFGYADWGPAGLGDDYPNATFRYQSQSGNVAGTFSQLL